MSQKVLLDIFETAFNKVVAHTACHFLILHKKTIETDCLEK